MEDKIEIGEYYRTKNGLIRKIKTIKSGKRQFTRTTVTLINGRHRLEDIVKHSKQLIDLIEVGDFVNGYQVYLEEGKLSYELSEHMPPYEFIKNIKIETVLTHQQFEANCYKVGGEDDGKGTNNK